MFIIFITWGILTKLWHFGVGADSLEVLQSEPVNYSGFQPSAVMPSLKPVPQEQLRAGKTSETAENVPETACTQRPVMITGEVSHGIPFIKPI